MNIYLSPSTQEKNIGVGVYGTEENRMNQLTDKVEVHLKRNRLNFFRNKTSFTPSQSANDSNDKIGSKGLHLALHSNSGGGNGAEIFYYSKSAEGKKFAKCVYDYLEELTPSKDRGIKPTNELTEIFKPLSVAILVEVDFHDNQNGVNFIIDKMDEIAQGIVKGICTYLKREYVSISENEVPAKTDKYYRVITGSFNDKKNADNRVKELKEKGFDSFIDTLKV